MTSQPTSFDFPSEVWAVIPARGGSVGVPRKNLISCAGKPLIQHVLDTAKDALSSDRVVVITDSQEIAEFARLLGVHVILEDKPSGPDETLDQKLHRNVSGLEALGAKGSDIILTLQATSPLTQAASIRAVIQEIASGMKSAITVANDPHLRWGLDAKARRPIPLFEARKNRQQLPPDYRETGGVVGVRLADLASTGTRILDPVGLVVVEDREAIDIDSFGNLFEAQHYLTKSKIMFRVEANRSLGMGHLYRCLAVAYELSRHEVIFVASEKSPLVEQVVRATPFKVISFADESALVEEIREFDPDLLFLDILDSDSETVQTLRKSADRAKIVTFENDGEGANLCDLGVYDLTPAPKLSPPHSLVGPQYSIIGPSFELFRSIAQESTQSRDIVLTFGGTDPAGLTEKALRALNQMGFGGEVTVVLGLGAREPVINGASFGLELHRNVSNMALLMGQHSLAISSKGRTVFELAAMGIPTLTFSQNEKEDQHVHIGKITGSVDGGKGYQMSTSEMSTVIRDFLLDSSGNATRRADTQRFRAERLNSKIVREILNRIGMGQLAFT